MGRRSSGTSQGGGRSILGGIVSSIAEGFTLGTGCSVAVRAVDAVMGPRTIKFQPVATEAAAAPAPAMSSVGGSNACNNHFRAFQDCLNSNGSEVSKCQLYLDNLEQCCSSSGGVLGA